MHARNRDLPGRIFSMLPFLARGASSSMRAHKAALERVLLGGDPAKHDPSSRQWRRDETFSTICDQATDGMHREAATGGAPLGSGSARIRPELTERGCLAGLAGLAAWVCHARVTRRSVCARDLLHPPATGKGVPVGGRVSAGHRHMRCRQRLPEGPSRWAFPSLRLRVLPAPARWRAKRADELG
nr:hypothetical protein CFP56_30130 [Quercus suber]